jgi:hypothetical protein
MRNRFQKVTEPQPGCVTVSLYEANGTARGDAVGPTQFEGSSLTTVMTPQDGSLTAAQAVGSGIRLANRFGVKVVVIDPNGLWDSNWGELVT